MRKKLWIGIAAIACLVLIYFLTPVKSYLTESAIREFIEQFGAFGPVVFGMLYFIASLALVSTVALSVLSGLLFGKFIGTAVVVTAATLSAIVAFLIGRYFGKDIAVKLSRGKKIGPFIQKVEKQVDKNGFQTFFILRCLFLPYILLSYASGVVQAAKLRDFFLATLITNVVFSFLFVYLGDSLLKGWKALLIPVLLVVLALQIPRIVKKFKKV